MNPQVVLLLLKTIDIVSAGLKLLPELLERKDRYIEQIKKMIEEDRGPSDDEMDALLKEGDDLTELIRRAVEGR